MKLTFTRGFLLATTLASLAGCGTVPHINPYKNVPTGNYFYGDVVPSAEYFAQQDKVVKPHCDRYARETNPSEGDMSTAYGVNHGVAGFAGGAGGSAADFGIAGAPVTAPLVLGNGAYYGIAAGTQGFITGAETSDQQVNGYTKWCIMADTGGYRSVSPSELEEIRKTGRSTTLEEVIRVDPAPKVIKAPPRP